MSAQNDIFIGNIHQRTTEDELREIFSVCGSISAVRILVDKETGRAKGYAFVEYTNIDSVNAAIRLLAGTELHGRALKVSYAAGTGGPGGGGSGGGGSSGSGAVKTSTSAGPGQSAANIASQLSLQECWDILSQFKGLVDDKQARVVLETYPQLVAGLAELEKRIGMA